MIPLGDQVLDALASIAIGTGLLFFVPAVAYWVGALLIGEDDPPEPAWIAQMAGALLMVFGFTLGALTARRAMQLSGDVAAAAWFALMFALARHGLSRSRGHRGEGR